MMFSVCLKTIVFFTFVVNWNADMEFLFHLYNFEKDLLKTLKKICLKQILINLELILEEFEKLWFETLESNSS